MIHVIAHERAAAAELAKCRRLDIARIEIDAAMIRGWHAAADFAGEIGIFLRVGGVAGLAIAERVVAHAGVGARGFESVFLPTAAGHRLDGPLPKAFRIRAEQRQQFAERRRRFHRGPTGLDVKRHINTCFDGHFLERHQVSWRAAKFVVHLNADDGATVFPEFALKLLGDLAVENFSRGEKVCVGRAQLPTALLHPIGETTVADFAVTPWAAADDDLQADFLARLEKFFQVTLAGPVPLTLDLLVMDPKDIRRHDVYAAGFHLE